MRTFQLVLLATAVGAELFFTSNLYVPSTNPTARLIAACAKPRTVGGHGQSAPPECARPELASND